MLIERGDLLPVHCHILGKPDIIQDAAQGPEKIFKLDVWAEKTPTTGYVFMTPRTTQKPKYCKKQKHLHFEKPLQYHFSEASIQNLMEKVSRKHFLHIYTLPDETYKVTWPAHFKSKEVIHYSWQETAAPNKAKRQDFTTFMLFNGIIRKSLYCVETLIISKPKTQHKPSYCALIFIF